MCHCMHITRFYIHHWKNTVYCLLKHFAEISLQGHHLSVFPTFTVLAGGTGRARNPVTGEAPEAGEGGIL